MSLLAIQDPSHQDFTSPKGEKLSSPLLLEANRSSSHDSSSDSSATGPSSPLGSQFLCKDKILLSAILPRDKADFDPDDQVTKEFLMSAHQSARAIGKAKI
ncbi:hypothetical protein PHJA_000695700 [Phtheirospermum japonicum]|uniref:Uncharacterized protein n=1 Tax=Phtheirospermum japonicum TaxID=374723 RepID=A0A830BD45_9LAMI|nr:hypothetical protein PHJA_000695700 [Phtheirospermum japonicum]